MTKDQRMYIGIGFLVLGLGLKAYYSYSKDAVASDTVLLVQNVSLGFGAGMLVTVWA